jgi:hypothetical protein
VKTRSKTLERELASIDPLAEEDPRHLASGPAQEELLRTILVSRPGGSGGTARTARRLFSMLSRRGRLAIGVPALTAVLFVSVVGIPGGGEGTPATLPALAKVAEAAADQPAPDTALPYRYQKTQSMYLDTAVWSKTLAWSYFESEIDEEWIAKDGSGRRHRVVAPVKFAGPEDREAWEAAGRPDFQPHAWSVYTEEETLRPGEDDRLYEAELAGVPVAPAAILDLLDRVTRSGNGFSPAVRSLNLVSEILNDPRATPELRAALYEAEGRVPGVEYLGRATDAIGRPGVAIGAESANSGAPTRYELIFDPETSQVLATEEITLEPPVAFPHQKTPVLSGAKLFLESGGVRSVGEKPGDWH